MQSVNTIKTRSDLIKVLRILNTEYFHLFEGLEKIFQKEPLWEGKKKIALGQTARLSCPCKFCMNSVSMLVFFTLTMVFPEPWSPSFKQHTTHTTFNSLWTHDYETAVTG